MTNSGAIAAGRPRTGWWRRGITPYLITSGTDAAADGVFYMALAWLAAKFVDGGAAAATVFAVGTLPLIVITLLGGVLADRLGAGRSAAITLSARIAMLLGFTVMCMRPEWVNLGSLIAFSVALGFADALHMPALSALAGLIANDDEQGRLQATVSATNRGSTVIATALGGVLIGWAIPAPGWLMVGLLTVSLAALTLVRRVPAVVESDTRTDDGGTTWTQLRQGLGAVRADSAVMLILVLLMVANFASTPPMTMGLALKGEEHAWSAAAYGLVFASSPVGMVIGAIAMNRFGARAEARRIQVACVVFFPCALGVLINALAVHPVWAAVGCFIAGLTTAPGGASLIGEVRARTKPEFMGRVMSIVMLSIFSFIPLGQVTFGLISDVAGTKAAGIVMAAALGVIAVVGCALQGRVASR